MVSMVDQDRVRQPMGLEPDWEKDDLVVTFEGVFANTPFVARIRALLEVLEDRLGTPVDIEFACDGDHLYLLQCRAQSYSREDAPVPIPRDLPRDRVVFTANRHVSNGRVPEITHVVYVDPEAYARLEQDRLRDVGRAVGRLNRLLPKRQFILIGPGRWGSRGDIRLGVSVTYADINNAAVLLEVAKQKGHYVPELSFGTHFFQDLVEAGIRYLPLYPDEEGIVFKDLFFRRATNILRALAPEYSHLADVVQVLDVRAETDGLVLRVLLNADLDEAVGLLSEPGPVLRKAEGRAPASTAVPSDEPLRWRLRMAEKIARHMDPVRFGVRGVYVFGSTKNATAGSASDVDLLVHVAGTDEQRRDLESWLEGWSVSLAEMNYLRTGYASDGLLDVHFVTDRDIEERTSYASKIDAVTDAARALRLGGA
jgi:predicted nucleotidyltransferase